MNRKRWTYLGVLVSSMTAFVVDRAFFSQPEEAAASTEATDSSSVPDTPSTEPPSLSAQELSQNAADPVLDWLTRIPAPSSVRDVFSMSGGFLAYEQKRQETAQKSVQAQKESLEDILKSFATMHELQSTLVSSNNAFASVDGKIMRVGDQIDGFRLIRIEARQADFLHISSGKTLALLIKPPAS